jgi:hypothetical protein
MRKVGLSRASAAFAGSRDGKTLSVIAITGLAISNSGFKRLECGGTYDSGVCPSTAGRRAVASGHHIAASAFGRDACAASRLPTISTLATIVNRRGGYPR